LIAVSALSFHNNLLVRLACKVQ